MKIFLTVSINLVGWFFAISGVINDLDSGIIFFSLILFIMSFIPVYIGK